MSAKQPTRQLTFRENGSHSRADYADVLDALDFPIEEGTLITPEMSRISYTVSYTTTVAEHENSETATTAPNCPCGVNL